MLIIEDLKTRTRSWRSTPQPGTNWKAHPGLVVMKFGDQLRSSVIREYQWYYLDYEGLKADLKNATGPLTDPADAKGKKPARVWSEEDEGRFVSKLESELDKVHTKQQVKALEISRRIAVSEREVKSVVERLDDRGIGNDGPSEEEFMLLEEDVSDIIADVHDLAKFVQLNYTGFYKIIKKHDVRYSVQCSQVAWYG
jgi:SPX domain protein involved in polyphosphate accumulation